LGVGLAAMAGLIPSLTAYTYPIVWWGLLLIVDGWNQRRHSLTLARTGWTHFLSITVPVSVLFWLFFELLNLPSPQWRYRGGIASIVEQSLFGFVAFATVLPIMAESWWLIAGSYCLPPGFAAVFRRWRVPSIVLGLVFAALPYFNHYFWLNQGMWLSPALILLPFARTDECARPGRFITALVVSALLAGFFWEMLNYGAQTHWEYLILRGAPHLFQMPVPGYIGFIPFALTSLVVYELQRRIPARPVTGIALYAAALTILYVLTGIYQQRGLWVLN